MGIHLFIKVFEKLCSLHFQLGFQGVGGGGWGGVGGLACEPTLEANFHQSFLISERREQNTSCKIKNNIGKNVDNIIYEAKLQN